MNSRPLLPRPSLLTVYLYTLCEFLTHKAPNTTIAEFSNTVDPDETAHNEIYSVCPLVFDFFNITQFILNVFEILHIYFFGAMEQVILLQIVLSIY